MKWVAAAVILVAAIVAPLALAQEGGSGEVELFLDADGGDDTSRSKQITQDPGESQGAPIGVYAENINPENDYVLNFTDKDGEEYTAETFNNFEAVEGEENMFVEWVPVSGNNLDLPLGIYDVEIVSGGESVASLDNGLKLEGSPLTDADGNKPRGLNDWIETINVSDVSKKQAAALAAVDRKYLALGFEPIPSDTNSMRIDRLVERTRRHAINSEGWKEHIETHTDFAMDEANAGGELELEAEESFFVSTEGNILTYNTPHRARVTDEQASNENIDRADDCYADYSYRPPTYGATDATTGWESYGSPMDQATAYDYECPGYVSSITDVIPSQQEAADPQTYCPDSMSEEQCIENVIRPTCESGNQGPGSACQAMLSDTVSGAEDFGKWRNYCNDNYNKGDVKLNATEIVSCMQGCYGTAGMQSGSFKSTPESSDMGCGELVQNFCSNTKYASYIPKSNEDSPNTCEVSLG